MFIQVKLLHGWQEPLWYEVPKEWEYKKLKGSLVRVPLQKRITTGLVIASTSQRPAVSFQLRKAIAQELFPCDTSYALFLDQLGIYYHLEPVRFYQRMRHFLTQDSASSTTHESLLTSQSHTTNNTILTDEQRVACEKIIPHIINAHYHVTLLHGVTGSGKTEVYKQLLHTAISANKSVLWLLPEVTLALQFEKIVRTQLPDIVVYGFHSATSKKDKRTMWQDLLTQKPIVIIGVHLPILLPIAHLGLIIIDEEHEVGYQEKKHPKINSKEAALIRARSANIPIVLGSATPSVNSFFNVTHKGWSYIQLTKRFAGNFPTIKTVYLSDGKQRRNFWISQELEQAIKQRLSNNEQCIIFLNRRGYSFFVQCKTCGLIFSCPQCSVSLTLHQDNNLTCHYCDFNQQLPSTCSKCPTDQKDFLKKGIGTQQVVAILEKLFPHARIARADLDVTLKKKMWQKTLNDFEQGQIDILVGTQTITKGLHFPRVTLVGILWADINLHFPAYNATETALQQLIQVAGRAGRQSAESLVIVQALAQHSALEFLDERTYEKFCTQELEQRQLLAYPPCGRFAEIEVRHAQEEVIEQEVIRIIHRARNIIHINGLSVQVLGPSKPGVHKIKNMHLRKIFLKANDMRELHVVYQQIIQKRFMCSLFFTPNPVTQ